VSEDYIRDELQKATATYINALRRAISSTRDAQKSAGSYYPPGSRSYVAMTNVEQFHEDRRMTLEVLLHEMGTYYDNGVAISFQDWFDIRYRPTVMPLEELMGKDLSEDERERIKEEFGVVGSDDSRSPKIHAEGGTGGSDDVPS